jgi:hypothetical protein
MSRPALYDPAQVWSVVLPAIANGSSLAAVLRRPGLPSYEWAKSQLRNNHTLAAAYEDAIKDRADFLAEQVVDLADEAPPEGLDPKALTGWVMLQRTRIDARKWAAARMNRVRWSESITVDVSLGHISITKALEEANARVQTIDAEVTEIHASA